MPINGYILIDGEKWLVSADSRKRDLALTKRSKGEDGIHLEEAQAFLNLPQHKWLKDPLRYGVVIYLPKFSFPSVLATLNK
jgi:hypothetical protein